MGYKNRPGTKITDFWPDNTDDKLYIASNIEIDFVDLIDEIKQHFKCSKADLEDFCISSENIHTSCVYYDMHDSSDYTNFLVITRKN